jgi:hypothetical protein
MPHAPRRQIPIGNFLTRRRFLFASALFLLALIVRWPFLGWAGFPADQAQFVMWSHLSLSKGVAAPYVSKKDDGRPWCNYPPLYVYALRGLGHFYDLLAPADGKLDESVARAVWRGDGTDAARRAATLHKLPAILADALTTALLFLWLAARLGRISACAVAAVYALSPAVVHNSSVWGQVDAIPALLMLASLEAARRGRVLWMTAWAMLAVLCKAQALMLAPVHAAVIFHWVRPAPGRLFQIAAVATAVALVVLLPFVGALDGVWHAYASATSRYPFTHLNGFSAWFLSTPLDAPHLGGDLSQWYRRDDLPGLFGLAPRTWGLFGVLALWASVFATLIRSRCNQNSLFWAARVLPLGFFVLSTQMHERYLFPAVALWAWSAAPNWRWWACWVLICACAPANAMWVWAGPVDAPWLAPVQTLLHGSGTGIACCVVLTGVLFVAVLDWPGRAAARPEGARLRTVSGLS